MSRLFFLISCFFGVSFVGALYTNILHTDRISRHCKKGEKVQSVTALPLEDHKVTLTVIFVSGLILLLITLGAIKGLIGLCCFRKFGGFGLHLLVDLPRPLSRYQENDLKYRPVVYDLGGWPIHPDTRKRTIRILSKQTEFCLNLVFFLACPLAACTYICSLCCCIRNYTANSCEDAFKHIDLIRLASGSIIKSGENIHYLRRNAHHKGYSEQEDTLYVFNAIEKSIESIQEIHDK